MGIGGIFYPAFRHHQPAGSGLPAIQMGHEPFRRPQIHLKRGQIPVVYAHQERLGFQHPFELGLVVHFHQGLHPQLLRLGDHPGKGLPFEGRRDEEHRIGPEEETLEDLEGVDDEILTQQRHRGDRGQPPEHFPIAAEKGAVGDHRHRRRPAGFVAAKPRGRISVGPDHASARRSALDLRDDR